MLAAASVVRGSAAAGAATNTLTIVVPGGEAEVFVEPAGLPPSVCKQGQRCTYVLTTGSNVTLLATGLFFGWTGECAGIGSACSVTMDGEKTVGLVRRLVVAARSADDVNGVGTVNVSPSGATCPPDCESLYENDATVTLTATAGAGSFLHRWDTCPDVDLNETCTLRTTQIDTEVDAIFLTDPTLQVGVTGGVPGNANDTTVLVSVGEPCKSVQDGSAECSYAVTPGATVTLRPNPEPGTRFVEWSVPECPNTGDCTISIDSRLRSVVATFLPTTLTVIPENDGTVTGGGINCPGTCSVEYNSLEEVTLTAVPATAEPFRGWNGVCEPAGTSLTCTIRLSGDDVAGAWFDGPRGQPEIIPPRLPVNLEVRKTGNGEGTVTSGRSRYSDAIVCGSGPGCNAVFRQGETATLVAQASPGSRFDSWHTPGGLCSTDLTCAFAVTKISSLRANFVKIAQPPPPPQSPPPQPPQGPQPPQPPPPCSVRKFGGPRADRLDGGARSDAIFGRGGNDRIRGLGGNDCLFGERGNDVVRGGQGSDVVNGGRGADELHGGPGRDTVRGERGRDRIFARDGARDVIQCGSARDTVQADRIDRVSGCESVRRR